MGFSRTFVKSFRAPELFPQIDEPARASIDPAKAISPALFLSHRAEKVSRPPGQVSERHRFFLDFLVNSIACLIPSALLREISQMVDKHIQTRMVQYAVEGGANASGFDA